MDKTQTTIVIGFIISFILGVLFQRYIGVNQLLISLNIRTLEYSDDSTRTLISSIQPSPLVILIAGQSNVANTLPTLSNESPNVYNFYHGKLYLAKDPLLGATGKQGSLWIRMAEIVIAQSHYDSVVLINVARGNSSINDWIDTGKFSKLIEHTYASASELNLAPDVILWGHGERDAIDSMQGEQYNQKLRQLMHNISLFHHNKPIIISITSKCYLTPNNNGIRTAQYKLVKDIDAIRSGPDTDRLGSQYRYDNCHFNNEGSDILVTDWTNSLLPVLPLKKSEFK